MGARPVSAPTIRQAEPISALMDAAIGVDDVITKTNSTVGWNARLRSELHAVNRQELA
jgi:hypothetical protein